MWHGARNPVAYLSLSTLGIIEKDLNFNTMPDVILKYSQLIQEQDPYLNGISIQQAKILLSRKYEVCEESIEIIIRA